MFSAMRNRANLRRTSILNVSLDWTRKKYILEHFQNYVVKRYTAVYRDYNLSLNRLYFTWSRKSCQLRLVVCLVGIIVP